MVENAPGANGMTGAAIVAKAAPDGYTLMIMANNHIVNPSLYKNMPFDAIKDFTWIATSPGLAESHARTEPSPRTVT